ncbi:hypothetical protein J2X69_004680 [Algoriphagus sp. 4150]|nr:hypothetical protein [Algoriphagus sp. 4150]
MKAPYDITPSILQLVSSISEKIGEANTLFLDYLCFIPAHL